LLFVFLCFLSIIFKERRQHPADAPPGRLPLPAPEGAPQTNKNKPMGG